MTPAILVLAPAVASAIGLPISDATQPSDIASGVLQFAGRSATETVAALTSVDGAAIDIIRVAYLTCLLVGVLLYYTHLGKRLGKDLIVGGAALLVLTELVIPAIAGLTA
jgi:hypothetical protein